MVGHDRWILPNIGDMAGESDLARHLFTALCGIDYELLKFFLDNIYCAYTNYGEIAVPKNILPHTFTSQRAQYQAIVRLVTTMERSTLTPDQFAFGDPGENNGVSSTAYQNILVNEFPGIIEYRREIANWTAPYHINDVEWLMRPYESATVTVLEKERAAKQLLTYWARLVGVVKGIYHPPQLLDISGERRRLDEALLKADHPPPPVVDVAATSTFSQTANVDQILSSELSNGINLYGLENLVFSSMDEHQLLPHLLMHVVRLQTFIVLARGNNLAIPTQNFIIADVVQHKAVYIDALQAVQILTSSALSRDEFMNEDQDVCQTIFLREKRLMWMYNLLLKKWAVVAGQPETDLERLYYTITQYDVDQPSATTHSFLYWFVRHVEWAKGGENLPLRRHAKWSDKSIASIHRDIFAAGNLFKFFYDFIVGPRNIKLVPSPADMEAHRAFYIGVLALADIAAESIPFLDAWQPLAATVDLDLDLDLGVDISDATRTFLASELVRNALPNMAAWNEEILYWVFDFERKDIDITYSGSATQDPSALTGHVKSWLRLLQLTGLAHVPVISDWTDDQVVALYDKTSRTADFPQKLLWSSLNTWFPHMMTTVPRKLHAHYTNYIFALRAWTILYFSDFTLDEHDRMVRIPLGNAECLRLLARHSPAIRDWITMMHAIGDYHNNIIGPLQQAEAPIDVNNPMQAEAQVQAARMTLRWWNRIVRAAKGDTPWPDNVRVPIVLTATTQLTWTAEEIVQILSHGGPVADFMINILFCLQQGVLGQPNVKQVKDRMTLYSTAMSMIWFAKNGPITVEKLRDHSGQNIGKISELLAENRVCMTGYSNNSSNWVALGYDRWFTPFITSLRVLDNIISQDDALNAVIIKKRSRLTLQVLQMWLTIVETVTGGPLYRHPFNLVHVSDERIIELLQADWPAVTVLLRLHTADRLSLQALGTGTAAVVDPVQPTLADISSSGSLYRSILLLLDVGKRSRVGFEDLIGHTAEPTAQTLLTLVQRGQSDFKKYDRILVSRFAMSDGLFGWGQLLNRAGLPTLAAVSQNLAATTRLVHVWAYTWSEVFDEKHGQIPAGLDTPLLTAPAPTPPEAGHPIIDLIAPSPGLVAQLPPVHVVLDAFEQAENVYIVRKLRVDWPTLKRVYYMSQNQKALRLALTHAADVHPMVPNNAVLVRNSVAFRRLLQYFRAASNGKITDEALTAAVTPEALFALLQQDWQALQSYNTEIIADVGFGDGIFDGFLINAGLTIDRVRDQGPNRSIRLLLQCWCAQVKLARRMRTRAASDRPALATAADIWSEVQRLWPRIRGSIGQHPNADMAIKGGLWFENNGELTNAKILADLNGSRKLVNLWRCQYEQLHKRSTVPVVHRVCNNFSFARILAIRPAMIAPIVALAVPEPPLPSPFQELPAARMPNFNEANMTGRVQSWFRAYCIWNFGRSRLVTVSARYAFRGLIPMNSVITDPAHPPWKDLFIDAGSVSTGVQNSVFFPRRPTQKWDSRFQPYKGNWVSKSGLQAFRDPWSGYVNVMQQVFQPATKAYLWNGSRSFVTPVNVGNSNTGDTIRFNIRIERVRCRRFQRVPNRAYPYREDRLLDSAGDYGYFLINEDSQRTVAINGLRVPPKRIAGPLPAFAIIEIADTCMFWFGVGKEAVGAVPGDSPYHGYNPASWTAPTSIQPGASAAPNNKHPAPDGDDNQGPAKKPKTGAVDPPNNPVAPPGQAGGNPTVGINPAPGASASNLLKILSFKLPPDPTFTENLGFAFDDSLVNKPLQVLDAASSSESTVTPSFSSASHQNEQGLERDGFTSSVTLTPAEALFQKCQAQYIINHAAYKMQLATINSRKEKLDYAKKFKPQKPILGDIEKELGVITNPIASITEDGNADSYATDVQNIYHSRLITYKRDFDAFQIAFSKASTNKERQGRFSARPRCPSLADVEEEFGVDIILSDEEDAISPGVKRDLQSSILDEMTITHTREIALWTRRYNNMRVGTRKVAFLSRKPDARQPERMDAVIEYERRLVKELLGPNDPKSPVHLPRMPTERGLRGFFGGFGITSVGKPSKLSDVTSSGDNDSDVDTTVAPLGAVRRRAKEDSRRKLVGGRRRR